MEFLKFVRKRSFISELVYTVLNITLAVGVLLIIRYTDSINFAIALVLLSKWRIFAVRPRFWLANLRSNLVDLIVSISVVLDLHFINITAMADGPKLLVMTLLTVLYIVWLLFIKPRSKRSFMAVQAGTAILLGISALFVTSYAWPVSVVVAVAWLVGYAAARHILTSFDDETHALFLSLAWGLVVAEISWVAYHWTIAYPLPVAASLMVPQVAIIITLVSFLAYKIYHSIYRYEKLRMADVILPLIFTVTVIVVLVFLFNRVGTAI